LPGIREGLGGGGGMRGVELVGTIITNQNENYNIFLKLNKDDICQLIFVN
jgi:hypothetical protein